jgi:hypothetical protein
VRKAAALRVRRCPETILVAMLCELGLGEILYFPLEGIYGREYVPEVHPLPRDGEVPLRGVQRLGLLVVVKVQLPPVHLLPVPHSG